MSAALYDFDIDTAVEAVADHRFAAASTDRWNVRPAPSWPSPASSS